MEPTPTEPNEKPTPAHRPAFVTPEMIEQNPLLKHAGVFAGNPIWDDVIAEIKKNRVRERRRVRRTVSK